jgi:hypothetical protein
MNQCFEKLRKTFGELRTRHWEQLCERLTKELIDNIRRDVRKAGDSLRDYRLGAKLSKSNQNAGTVSDSSVQRRKDFSTHCPQHVYLRTQGRDAEFNLEGIVGGHLVRHLLDFFEQSSGEVLPGLKKAMATFAQDW